MDSDLSKAGEIPQLRDDLIVRQVEGELIVWDRGQQRIHLFNETAGFILEQCDGDSSVSTIASRAAEVFNAEASKVEPHVESTLERIRAEGLLESEPEARFEDFGSLGGSV